MELGTTFSHRKIIDLQLDPVAAFNDLLSLNFDIIRLPTYWSEIEVEKGKYDFERIKTQLDLCQKSNQRVIITLGMKAPRWPEFYIPEWIDPANFTDRTFQDSLLTFIQQTITELQHFTCITHWQVENEALDPSGPEDKTIPIALITQEIALVRSIDSRPIHTTLWGNVLTKRNNSESLAPLVDSIGIDLYFKQFLFDTPLGSVYGGPQDSLHKIHSHLANQHTPYWITELQAEPWEKDEETYASENPGSLSPEQLQKNFALAKQLQPEKILFWGYEYWYWKKQRRDDRYWHVIKEFLDS